MRPNPTIAGPDVQLSEEARAFGRRHDLMDHLAMAIELARQCFTIVGRPRVQLEQDPEDGEWYLVLEVQCRGDERECRDAHKRYLKTWASSAPWPAVHLIRLICHMIDD
jgi:hypothetical protein